MGARPCPSTVATPGQGQGAAPSDGLGPRGPAAEGGAGSGHSRVHVWPQEGTVHSEVSGAGEWAPDAGGMCVAEGAAMWAPGSEPGVRGVPQADAPRGLGEMPRGRARPPAWGPHSRPPTAVHGLFVSVHTHTLSRARTHTHAQRAILGDLTQSPRLSHRDSLSTCCGQSLGVPSEGSQAAAGPGPGVPRERPTPQSPGPERPPGSRPPRPDGGPGWRAPALALPRSGCRSQAA